jgi:hypothetical protein
MKRLGILNNKVNDMIHKNNTYRLNITAAQLMQQQDVKHWRLRGASDNWSLFKEMTNDTQHRLDHYKTMIRSIEETVESLQRDESFTPASVGRVIEKQGKVLISLAGRVAELHEQVERLKSKKK